MQETVATLPCILIVDDVPENIHPLADLLARDYVVLVAVDGERALDIARRPEKRPDLILLDVMMPGMDGFEMCRRLKADAATRDIPVIFMTALTGVEHKLAGFQAGAVDYVTKPLEAVEVQVRVKTHLALRAARQRLELQEADLRRAQSVGQLGSWRLDVRRNALTWSDENYRLFGIPRGTPLNYESFLDCVHPDERDYVHARWQAALHGETYDIEHRLLVDGREIWLRQRAELEFDAAGNLIGGFGTSQDITARKRAEAALLGANQQFGSLIEALPDAILYKDGVGRWLLINQVAMDFLQVGDFSWQGMSEAELAAARPAFRRVHEICMQLDEESWEARGPTHVILESPLPGHEGRQIDVRRVPLFESDGSRKGMLVIGRDVTERLRAEAALREASQRKDEFLAMLAHELRNPLAPIRNAAHILGLLQLDEPRVQWAQRIIENQVNHLTHLVDDLLDVSRIVQGKVMLKQETLALNTLLAQAVETARPLFEAKRHRFVSRFPAAPVCIVCDPVRLTQVLINLLDNAAKYTQEGGEIELCAEVMAGEAGREVEIVVHDNGPGITPELLPWVFDLFQQGERTLERAQGGLGIGLTLVRKLVEMHGGQATVESAGAGRGTTFRIRLPVVPEVVAYIPAPSPSEPALAPARKGTALRILVVDDEPDVALSTALFLRMEGHEVCMADSGEAALALFTGIQPQVVLLDIGLPGQDGYQVAQSIRLLPGGDAVKLVAMSGYGHDAAVARCQAAGFDRHLVKPVEPAVLCALLAGQTPVSEYST